ncbi:MAG: hypothetical protein ACXADA_14790 [Candidatus Hodarchaeales archaeon]|jgi:predicted  nucleic acid-binding Zn-ribbon protein
MDGVIDISESISREEINKIFQTVPNLELEIKSRIDKKISDSLSVKIKRRSFRICSIVAKGNRNTEYPGFSSSIDSTKSISVVIGPSASGKTTTCDKLAHFFLRYESPASRIKELTTVLDFIVEDLDNKKKYKIKFHSRGGLEGKRFKVLEEKSGLFSPLSNPETFLKESLLIDYDFNSTMFIPENSRFSFVNRYCINETQFRKLFRLPMLNAVFNAINAETDLLSDERKRFRQKIDGTKAEMDRLNHQIPMLSNNVDRTEFWIKNESELLTASDMYSQKEITLRDKEKRVSTEIKSLNKDLRQKEKELEKVDELHIEDAKNKVDLLRLQQRRSCWQCDIDIPPKVFNTRVYDNLCFICGIGDYNYSEELKVIPDEDLPEIKKERRKYIEEIKEIRTQIKNLSKEIEKIIPKPRNINSRIWNTAKRVSKNDIIKEIELAKGRIKEINTKLEKTKKEFEERRKFYDLCNKELEKNSIQFDNLRKIEDELLCLGNDAYKSLKHKIFSDVNQALMNVSDENAGELYFNNDGELYLKTTLVIDEKEQQITHKYNLAKLSLSPGQSRRIDFAFSLAILKSTFKKRIKPINMLIIDGLNYISTEDKKYILEGLAHIPGVKTFLFDVEVPIFLSKGKYEIINIHRNKYLRKSQSLKNKTRHRALIDFFQ